MAERGESGGGDVINIKRFLVGSDCAADATELTVQAGGAMAGARGASMEREDR